METLDKRKMAKSDFKRLSIGLTLTILLSIVCYFNNKLGAVYVPTAVLTLGGFVATFLWVVKSSSGAAEDTRRE